MVALPTFDKSILTFKSTDETGEIAMKSLQCTRIAPKLEGFDALWSLAQFSEIEKALCKSKSNPAHQVEQFISWLKKNPTPPFEIAEDLLEAAYTEYRHNIMVYLIEIFSESGYFFNRLYKLSDAKRTTSINKTWVALVWWIKNATNDLEREYQERTCSNICDFLHGRETRRQAPELSWLPIEHDIMSLLKL